MPKNLVVQQGTQLVLDENPPEAIAAALQRVQINTLQDLVDAGVVRSQAVLGQLLDAAKAATTAAVRLRETYTPPTRVFGRVMPDLRRFGAYRAAAPEVLHPDAEVFWRVVRDIEPTALAALTPVSRFSEIASLARFREIIAYLFADVEVQSNSVLAMAPSVHVFTCGDLTIRTGGKILVLGSAIVIKAFSIQGNV